MKLQLIFGIAYQIPYGFSNRQIEERFRSRFAPLIKKLYHSRQVCVTLHLPGHLLWWIEHNYSEYITVLKEMMARNQVEILGGGYYDPIPSLIPRSDYIGQIETSTTYIRKLFGKRVHGAWIHDQIWDDNCAATLNSCNMKYSFLTDNSVLGSSVITRNNANPVITENEGRAVAIFLTNSALYAWWESGRPYRVVSALREIYATQSSLGLSNPVGLFDLNNTTLPFARYDRFFNLLNHNSGWLETVLPHKVWQNSAPLRKSYFFNETTNQLRASLVFHREKALVYAKMHHIYILVNQIRGDKYRKKLAQEFLWQSQNCYSYITMREGGYSNIFFVRKAYRYLIEAEQIARSPEAFVPSIQSVDFDYDGVEEYLFRGRYINAYLHRQGGSVFELDFFPTKWNWIDSAHKKRGVPKKRGAERTTSPKSEHAPEDQPPSNAFIDYIMPTGTTTSTFKNFLRRPQLYSHFYDVQKIDREHLSITFSTRWYVDAPENIIEIIKQYHFEASLVRVDYQLINRCNTALRCIFATQTTLTPSVESHEEAIVQSWNIEKKTIQVPKKRARIKIHNVERASIFSPPHKHGVDVECSGSDELWYQHDHKHNHYTFIPCWYLNLGPNDTRSLRVSLKIMRPKKNTH